MEWMVLIQMCFGSVCEFFYVPELFTVVEDCAEYSKQYGAVLANMFPQSSGEIACIDSKMLQPLIDNQSIGMAQPLDQLQ